MNYRFGLMGKIAVSLFISSLIIMFLGITVLYTRFRTEAMRMNQLLQEANLEIAGENIVEKMDAAEYTAISLFFDKDMRNILLSKREVNNKVELHNQVYGNFLRILNTTSSISRITLYRKDGFSVSAGLENNYGHFDYDSCLKVIQKHINNFSEESNYAVWIPVLINLQNGTQEAYFMNARILRDVSSSEPVGILTFYVKEKVISQMYSFFGKDSYLTDSEGKIISAQDRERIGKMEEMDNTGVPETVFVSVGDRQWYLTAVPENTILDATQDTAFFTMMTAAGFCTFLSMAAAFLISRGLTHNIKYLKEIIECTGAGNLNLRYQGKSGDEVDYLGKAYNKMLDDIQGYIAEDKKKQKQIQDGKIKFLQAQINPHLLYNTLDVAIFYMEKSNMDMALHILRSMSSFFKLSLGKGEPLHSIRTELSHITYYMQLQRLCRGKEIELFTDIPESLMEIKIPRITFQPIIENAYLHAFQGTINDGWIKIGVSRKREMDKSVLHICIMDNGMGMDEVKTETIEAGLHSEKCGENCYGLWNVYRRLKLYYGESCRMSLESEFGEYTKVIFAIPEEEENVQSDDY